MVVAVEALGMGCFIRSSILVIWHSLIASMLWDQFWLLNVLLLGIRTHIHVIVDSFLVVLWEAFLSCHIVILLRIIFEEGLGGWRLRIVVADVATVLILDVWLTEVLALFKTLFTDLYPATHVGALTVVTRVSIMLSIHISSFDHW